jgi:hypothetical protein
VQGKLGIEVGQKSEVRGQKSEIRKSRDFLLRLTGKLVQAREHRLDRVGLR